MIWLPIETAPKTGERILVFVPALENERGNWDATVDLCYWNGKAWMTPDHQCGGWEKDSPTHWMPLPGQPK